MDSLQKMIDRTKVSADKNEVEIRGFLPDPYDPNDLFERLHPYFTSISETRELVIFFKYERDIRLRFTRDGAEFLVKRRPKRELSRRYQEQEDITVSLEQAESLTRFVTELGYAEGLFSECQKYISSGDVGTFCLKRGTVCGDFWELGRMIRDDEDPEVVRNGLVEVAEDLALEPWSDETYDAHRRDCWKEEVPQRLIDSNGRLHHQIEDIIALYNYAAAFMHGQNRSIRRVAESRSNNYTDQEDAYRLRYAGCELLDREPRHYRGDFELTASIIIPMKDNFDVARHALRSIAHQALSPGQRKAFDVIVVDDGSAVSMAEDTLDGILKELRKREIAVNFIRTQQNLGRARARNLGLNVAQGDVILFLDSDVVLEQNYLREMMVRHQTLNDIVLVGFKQNVKMDDPRLRKKNLHHFRPDIGADFRFESIVEPGWNSIHPVEREETIRCVEESQYFKEFGRGRVIGAWDLAGMVVSHNVSVRRSWVEQIRGFAREFDTGWGLEDTFFGKCLIACGCYVVPLLSTGVFHIDKKQERESGTREEKHEELGHNVPSYRTLIERPLL